MNKWMKENSCFEFSRFEIQNELDFKIVSLV